MYILEEPTDSLVGCSNLLAAENDRSTPEFRDVATKQRQLEVVTLMSLEGVTTTLTQSYIRRDEGSTQSCLALVSIMAPIHRKLRKTMIRFSHGLFFFAKAKT